MRFSTERQGARFSRLDIATVLLLFPILLVCCTVPASAIVNGVSLAAGVIFAAYIALSRPASVFKYLPFWFSVLANVAGCAACEFTIAYLPELGIDAHTVGSLPLLVLAQSVFAVAIAVYDAFFGVEKQLDSICKPSARNQLFLRVASAAVAGFSIALFLSVAENPSFLLGYDRFQYANEFGSRWAGAIAGWLTFLIIIPALLIRRRASNFDLVLGLTSVVFYVLYFVWVGEKFGSFFSLLWIFVLVFYDAILKVSIRVLRLSLGVVLLAFVLLLGFTVYAHSFTSTAGASDYLTDRVAQQGQLWWRTFELCEGESHPADFSREIDAFVNPRTNISDNVGAYNGIYGIMYFTTPSNMVDAKLAAGSRYTEAGYASAYYYFGPFGVIVFAVLMGFVIAAFRNALLRSLWYGWFLESAAWLRLSFLLQTALSMFTFYMFTTRLSIVCVVFLIACAIARQTIFVGRIGGAEAVHGEDAEGLSKARALR